jgi:methylenetetrahydrofolate reductase (NADPH)
LLVADLDNLKRKVDAGANRATTQFFFNPECFFRYQDSVAAAGIDIEILPGIMPVTRIGQVRRFVEHHGVTIPARLLNALERCETPRETRELGIAWATEQCRELLERGAPGVHFYTFNRSLATRRVMHAIGNYPD